MTAVLALLDGSVRVARRAATRLVTAGDFFLGPLESALAAGGARHRGALPGAAADARAPAFVEVARRHGDYALCGVAAVVRLDDDGTDHPGAGRRTCRSAPSPLVLDLTEAAAAPTATGGLRRPPAQLARQQLDPEADIHATADYRRHLAGVLTRRALLEALGEAQVRAAPGAARRAGRRGTHQGRRDSIGERP